MTEMTAQTGSALYPTRTKQRHLVDPVAFFVALIGAPLLVTSITCWMFIPVVALIIGGPVYLAIGTPVLLWYLSHHEATYDAIIGLAVLSILALFVGASLVAVISGDESLASAATFYCGFGSVFALLWSATFTWLYLTLLRKFYAPPPAKTET